MSLTQEERDAIDTALVDVYRAIWAKGGEPEASHLRAAYMQGRVDVSLGRSLPGVLSTRTERRSL